MIVVVTGSSASSGESLWPAARQAMRRRGAVLGLLRCFGRAVLFDRSADLRHDIGAGPLGHGEPSIRDLTCAPDGERLRTQHVVAKTYAPSEGRRLLRADRHGRLQTGELGSERMSPTMSALPWRPASTGAMLHTRWSAEGKGAGLR